MNSSRFASRLAAPLSALSMTLALGVVGPPAQAWPLEQNFAFGAPPSALGNDRLVRAPLAAPTADRRSPRTALRVHTISRRTAKVARAIR